MSLGSRPKAYAVLQMNLCWSVQVAFSAFTDFGAVMALAIAVHNIPEVSLLSAIAYPALCLHICLHICTCSHPVGHGHNVSGCYVHVFSAPCRKSHAPVLMGHLW